MATTRFHVNKNGDPGPCRATRRCPLGGDLEADHYDTPEEARAAFERKQREEETLLTTHRKEGLEGRFTPLQGRVSELSDEKLLAHSEQRLTTLLQVEREAVAGKDTRKKLWDQVEKEWTRAGRRGSITEDPRIKEAQAQSEDYRRLTYALRSAGDCAADIVTWRSTLKELPKERKRVEGLIHRYEQEGDPRNALPGLRRTLENNSRFRESCEKNIADRTALLEEQEAYLASLPRE